LSRTSSSSQVCYSLDEVSKRLRELVEDAMQSVWITTAFIDRCGVELLKKAGDRGAQVRVLTSAEVDEDILRELAGFVKVRVIKSLVECVEVLMASRTLYTPYL
jgi:phosphatidylserine/phosphatidylglycerophosphate/cardiolipin synthase-like enzyme